MPELDGYIEYMFISLLSDLITVCHPVPFLKTVGIMGTSCQLHAAAVSQCTDNATYRGLQLAGYRCKSSSSGVQQTGRGFSSTWQSSWYTSFPVDVKHYVFFSKRRHMSCSFESSDCSIDVQEVIHGWRILHCHRTYCKKPSLVTFGVQSTL